MVIGFPAAMNGRAELARPLLVGAADDLFAACLSCLRMNPPGWLAWFPLLAPFLLLLKLALLPTAAWALVLTGIFAAASI